MVGQRQRLASKLCREAHRELFPVAEHTPSEVPDSTKKKKKKKIKLSKLKRKKPMTNGIEPNKVVKSSLERRPLRVPCLKPGQGYFICKGQDHIAKLCPEKSQWEKNKVCFLFPAEDHSLKHCPNKDDGSVLDVKVCYNCGETGHSLASCPRQLQVGGSKFANCFICHEPEHLSKNCPPTPPTPTHPHKNGHGIYPKGGYCKTCGGVSHLAKDCPEKGKKSLGLPSRSGQHLLKGKQICIHVDLSKLVFYVPFEIWETPRPQVTKFVSGDDLDDDFMADKKDTVSSTIDSTSTEGCQAKAKKKQGTKIINFVG